MKFERDVTIYADQAILKRFQANETSLSIVQGKIEAMISESELVELQNSQQTMYSKLMSLDLTVSNLSLSFSDLTTKYDTVSDQYTEMDSKLAEYKAGVDGLSAEISNVQQNLKNNYSTTLQMQAAIQASIDGLSSTISKNYVTNSELENYSTTEQMQSAIDQKANEITTSVSQTYVTNTELATTKSDILESAQGYADEAEAAANANTSNLLKSYSTTTEMNSAINQKADQITSTVSQTYATKESVTESAQNTLNAANQNVTEQLKNYVTSTQMESAIDQKADEITSTVSKTYATLENVSDAKDEAISSANSNTANQLKNYSTTSQMNSAISQKANEITTTVSNTYVTKTTYEELEETIDSQFSTISSQYTQLADKFSWVVSGGTSSSNFTITSRMAQLVANDINLNGRVTFNGLDSSTQSLINSASSWVSTNGTNMTNLRAMILKWTDNAVSTTTQINGGWIATNTITADKIALGDFTNYATDGTFELNIYSSDRAYSVVDTLKHSGKKCMKMASGASGYCTYALNEYKNFPVTAGEKIYVEWYGYRDSANQDARINIQIVDQDGANVHYDIQDHINMSASATNATWIKYSYVATVQSTGFGKIQFKKAVDGTLSGNWYVDDVVVRRMTSGELIVSGSITADKLSVTSLESISARIGGWTISGNNLMNDKTNFSVKFQAATTYGGFGVGSNDILAVFDKTAGNNPFVLSSDGTVTATKCNFSGGTIGGWKITGTDIYNDNGTSSAGIGKSGTSWAFWAGASYADRNSAPVRIGHAGEFYLGTYLRYLPKGYVDDTSVKLRLGGWQIKTGTNAWGYDHFEYMDTEISQENGICAHGPWVVWGGWNGDASIDVNNYKFVVTDQGICKAMSWVTGSRVEWKENIVAYSKNAVQEIMNSDVYYYDLKDKGRSDWQEGRHIGFIIGDGYNVSPDILDGGGSSIDMYSALAIAYKAIQEQQVEIEELKKKINQ